MSGDYRYLLSDSFTGDFIGELPFTPTSDFSRLLTGCGAAEGTIPLDDAMASEANFLNGLRSLTAMRDDQAFWFGPVVFPVPDLESRTLTLSCREPTWWWQKRVVEVDKHYNADTHSIVRKLWTYVTTKTDSGGINAALPNMTVSSGLSGVTKRLVYAGSARRTMQDGVDLLCEDPDTGLEYRTDYDNTSNRQVCNVTFTLGSPLGTTVTDLLTEHVLFHYGRGLDNDRASTRAHVVGAGHTSTKQNTGSISAGWPLIDGVIDRSDTADVDTLDNIARELRRKSNPPVRMFDAEYVPNDLALPFGFCNLGDTLTWDTSIPDLLSISNSGRRVTEIHIQPPGDGNDESVGLVFNLPLDTLGT